MTFIIALLVLFAVVCFIFSFMLYTKKIDSLLGLYNNIEFKSNEHRNKFCITQFRHYLICGVLFLITAVIVYIKLDAYLYTVSLMIIVLKMACQQSKLKQIKSHNM